MIRAKLLALGLGLAILALFAAPAAGAQDGPSLTVEPASVEAAGEQEFTFEGAGFTAAPIFVLGCNVPESGDAADIAEDGCDTANLVINTPEDGAFSGAITIDVPEGGIFIIAGDQAQTEAASQLITVGAAEEAPAEEAPEEAPEEDLAVTGAETTPLAIAGGAILAAGAMLFGFSRRYDS